MSEHDAAAEVLVAVTLREPGEPVSATAIREALALHLDHSVSPTAPGASGDLLVPVMREELTAAIEALLELDATHVMLTAFCLAGPRVGRSPRVQAGLAVEEVMAVPNGPLVRLRIVRPADDPSYQSITPLVPAAQWDEREARDLHGVTPVGHPDPRPLVIHDAGTTPASAAAPASSSAATPASADAAVPSPYAPPPAAPAAPEPTVPPTTAPTVPDVAPYRSFVAHGDGVYQLPVGPIHAGVIEPGHFRFSAVGESVLYLDARLFYAHRGIERMVEGRPFAGALPVIERACGVCTVTHATAYSRAVEELTGTVPPARAQMGRVLLAEMERLYNHVGDLGNICAGVGFNYGISRLGFQKERLLRLNERLTGHRYLMGVVAPGGLRLELDERGLVGLGSLVTDIEHEVRATVRHIVRSEGVMNRLHTTGILTNAEARRLGALGVAARASGQACDLRIDRPTDGYREIQVASVGASSGDVAARFHVRAQEVGVSAAIVADLAGRIPDGEISVPLGREPRSGEVALAGAEGPRGASWIWLMAGPKGTVARLHLRSASFANWPIVAAVVPGNIVPDFPLINKSFELCYACTDR